MKTYCISFAYNYNNCWSDIYDAQIRLHDNLKKCGFQDDIHFLYKNEDIKSLQENYPKHFNSKYHKGKKYFYGYYLWKPYLILQLIKNINDGDYVFYSDVGMAYYGKRFKDFLFYRIKNKLSKNLVFPYKNDSIKKRMKSDFFHLTETEKYKNCFQFQAGTLFFKKNKKNIKFVQKWFDWCTNIELIDEYVRYEKNIPEYNYGIYDMGVLTVLYHMIFGFEYDMDYDKCCNLCYYGMDKFDIKLRYHLNKNYINDKMSYINFTSKGI